MLALPRARVRTVVLRVDADERNTIAVVLHRGFEALRLVDARQAPGRPEVQHDRLAPPQRREVDAPVTVKAPEVERGRRRMLPLVERRRDALLVVGHDAPDEQREQPHDERNGQRLGTEPELASHQVGMMKTVVPMFTWLKSHSASGMCIRMHPCETE